MRKSSIVIILAIGALICFTHEMQAQVLSYMVICDNNVNELIVVKSDEVASYTNASIIKENLPNKNAARSWMKKNYSSNSCDSKISNTVNPPPPPPPPTPQTNNDVPPPPEKKITHIYGSKFSLFGTLLFDVGDWVTRNVPGGDYKPWMAGIAYRNGNKVKFGFEASFQGWGKVLIPSGEEKLLATATASFTLAYPVALDKQGRFWILPEVGIGVDFYDVFQIGDELGFDQKIASPSFFLRIGVETYYLRPFFYYGRTMLNVDNNKDLKPNHIGAGLAVTFGAK